jgi:hypothetical protein
MFEPRGGMGQGGSLGIFWSNSEQRTTVRSAFIERWQGHSSHLYRIRESGDQRDGKWICTQDGLKLVEKEFTAPRTPGCGAPLLPTYPRTHVCLLKARAQGVRSSEAGSEVQGEEA